MNDAPAVAKGGATPNAGVRVLRSAERLLTGVETTLLVVSLALSVGFLVVDILLRVTINVALPWAAEATRYAIVWLVFIGGSRAALLGAHITIDALPELLPARAARVVTRLSFALSAASCAVLAWFSLLLVLQMTRFSQLSPSLEVPMWWVYLALPVGFAMMTIRFLQAFATHDARNGRKAGDAAA